MGFLSDACYLMESSIPRIGHSMLAPGLLGQNTRAGVVVRAAVGADTGGQDGLDLLKSCAGLGTDGKIDPLVAVPTGAFGQITDFEIETTFGISAHYWFNQISLL
jgi:hypothetical protein